MVELHANDTDGAREKHMPQVTVDGATVTVKVGEVAHPMTEPHFITMIVLVTEKGLPDCRLRPPTLPRPRSPLPKATSRCAPTSTATCTAEGR